MTQLLLIGVGPLPPEAQHKLFAPGLRLWNFARQLVRDGHQLTIAEAFFANEQPQPLPPQLLIEEKTVPRFPLSLDTSQALRELTSILNQLRPECIISNTELLNYVVARLNPDVPIWLDYHGCPMAERQLQAKVYNSDGGLLPQWQLTLGGLTRGDHFSTCSEPQKFALIGQLSACGRLNRFNAHHDLVSVLPSSPPFASFRHSQQLLKGIQVPEDSFVILWNGGYNTWTDVETLYRALAHAMEQSPTIHYVSTGGALKGHDERTFERFLQLVKRSPFHQRFHFLGWVELEDLHNLYFEADLAINIDSFSYEALLGSRNRLFNWLVAGLPVITTTLSEMTRLFAEKGLVTSFSPGDWGSLAELFLAHQRDPTRFRQMAAQGKEFLTHHYTNEKLLAPLREWARTPQYAPDIKAGEKNPLLLAQLHLLSHTDSPRPSLFRRLLQRLFK